MARPRPLIAFISDFGLRDPYVGVVHAVVERLGGGRVKMIDVAHDLPSFSVLAGSYVLYTSYRYFPEGTVFLVVVDPGVGTRRRAVALETRRYFFVGPDNGVLWQAASEDGLLRAWSIENEALMLKPVSASFHGRDVFAPAAVHIALGGDPSALGSRIDPDSLARLEILQPCPPKTPEARVKVVYVDRFGNVALGLRGRDCYTRVCQGRDRVTVCSKSKCVTALCRRVFGEAEPGQMVVYLNSFDFVELAVYLGSAAQELNVEPGSELTLRSF